MTQSSHTSQHRPRQWCTAQQSTAQSCKAQLSTTQQTPAMCNTVKHSPTPCTLTQPSSAQHSPAQHSIAQPSPAQHSPAQPCTAQHSPAQHSTAQTDLLRERVVDCRVGSASIAGRGRSPAGLGRPAHMGLGLLGSLERCKPLLCFLCCLLLLLVHSCQPLAAAALPSHTAGL